MNYATIILARPLDLSDPIFMRDEDGYLFPRVLGAYAECGLMQNPLLSMPDIVPSALRTIIEEWGFQCFYSQHDLPQKRLQESFDGCAEEYCLVLTPYAYLLDAEMVAEGMATVDGSGLDALSYDGVSTASHFLICSREAIDRAAALDHVVISPFNFVKCVSDVPIVTQRLENKSPNELLQSLLFKVLYRQENSSVPGELISYYLNNTERSSLFTTASYEELLVSYLGIENYAGLSRVVDRYLDEFMATYVASQVRSIGFMKPYFPEKKECFLEIGFGRSPISAMLLTNEFENGVAIEPYYKYSTHPEVVVAFSRSVGTLGGIKLDKTSHVNEICNRLAVYDRSLEGVDLPADSVDFIYSKTTLEHVVDIETLSMECKRVLRPGGRMLHVIDHSDHSEGIRFDFLRYDMDTWAKESRYATHNQLNLWRINDYIDHWEGMGLKVSILERLVRKVVPDNLHSCWKSYADEDLYCYNSILLVEKPSVDG